MTGEQFVGSGGPVSIGPLTFQVEELSVKAEFALLRRLKGLAKDALGPGSYYKNAAPTLDWLQQQGKHQDRAVILQTVAQLLATAAPLGDDAAEEFRQTPDGAAEEMFWRTRKTHAEVTLAELKAILNEANVLEVHLQILEAISPKKARTPSPSPAG